jgi:hypothetical protein
MGQLQRRVVIVAAAVLLPGPAVHAGVQAKLGGGWRFIRRVTDPAN